MRVTSNPSLLMASLSMSSAAFAAPAGYGRSPDLGRGEASPLLGMENSPVARSAERMETFAYTPPGFRRRNAAAYEPLTRRQLAFDESPSTESVTGVPQGLPINTGTINSIGTIGSVQAGGVPGIVGAVQGVSQGGLTTDLQGITGNGLGIGSGLGLGTLLPTVVTGTVGGLLNSIEGLLPIGNVIQATSGLPVVGSLPLSSIGAALESPMRSPGSMTESATGYIDSFPGGSVEPGNPSSYSLPGGFLPGTPLAPPASGLTSIQSVQQAAGGLTAAANGVPVLGGQVGGITAQASSDIQSATGVTSGGNASAMPAAGTVAGAAALASPETPSASASPIVAGVQSMLPGSLPNPSNPAASSEEVASAASNYPGVVAAIQSVGATARGAASPPVSVPAVVAQAVPTGTAVPTSAATPTALAIPSNMPASSALPSVVGSESVPSSASLAAIISGGASAGLSVPSTSTPSATA